MSTAASVGLNAQKKINDKERLSINDEYWSLMDYSRKKDFLLANIEVNNVERVCVAIPHYFQIILK